jgi:UDP-GlcNAc3NAcA epimerase
MVGPSPTRILTVVGARPQFIKAAAVSHVFARRPGVEEILVHTGQHYDDNMSAVFFRDLDLPKPRFDLGMGGLTHGAMTGRILERLEEILLQVKPGWVLLYGDTNSTLAGVLAAAKLHIPVAHVEAGLRSHNLKMPEEINRIVADRFSRLLFCPSPAAAEQLAREGIGGAEAGIHVVGDVMYDMTLFARARASSIDLARFGLGGRPYTLATIHRQENTDERSRLDGILTALEAIADDVAVLLPLHPRCSKAVRNFGWADRLRRFNVTEPLPYLVAHALMMNATAVLTDSGGVQKEAFFHRVPALTLRDETEWGETVALGWNQVCGADTAAIVAAWRRLPVLEPKADAAPYGDGHTAEKIVDILLSAS